VHDAGSWVFLLHWEWRATLTAAVSEAPENLKGIFGGCQGSASVRVKVPGRVYRTVGQHCCSQSTPLPRVA